MTVAVGHEGELKWGSDVVALAREISLELNKDALETTTMGVRDRSYIPGLRSATGSCTLLYDSSDTVVRTFLNRITSNNTQATDGTISLNFTTGGARFTLPIVITNVSISASSGDIVTASVQFQATGTLPASAF